MLPDMGPGRLWRRSAQYLMLGLCIFLLTALLVYPILLTVRGGFYEATSKREGFTLHHIAMVFQDPRLCAKASSTPCGSQRSRR